jgi:VWFA-related protein
MRALPWPALAACLLSSGPSPSHAQQPAAQTAPAQTQTLHVTTQLVVLDVVVTAKDSALRTDLRKDDFHVTEDGVPQKILYFEPPSAHHVPAGIAIHSTAELNAQAPQAPVTVVVLDELNTRFEDMGYARYALEKYLNAQPSQLSAPTMLLAVSAERLQVLSDYTQDRAVILNALKKHLANYPWELQRNLNRIRQMVQSLGALEQVAQATAGHPGHKNLLWVGHGFPGVELSNPNIDAAAAQGLKAAVEQAVDMLRDDRMTLYTIDPAALSSTVSQTTDDDSGPLGDIVDPATDPFVGDVNFIALAKATGGKSFFSRNDVDAEIGESARDGLNYYTIAYRPAKQSDATQAYRKIRVTFTQPGLHAGLRDGYYTADSARDNPAVNRATYDIDAAVENTLVYTGLDVHAVARPDTPGDYVVGVPEVQLTWQDEADGQSSRLTIAAADIDAKGKVLRRITNDLTARRPAGPVAAPASELVRSELKLPLVPGTKRLRIVVRAANGRIGSTDLVPAGTSSAPAPGR